MPMAAQATKHVKNVSDVALDIPNIGRVEPNGTIEVPVDFHNANFEEVKKVEKKETKESTK